MSAPSVSTHPTRRAVLAAGLSLAATAGASAQGSGMITQKPRMQSTEGARTMATMTTTDGTEIFYKDWGSGQPIVFHHGWPLSADDWDSQMLFFLNQGYRVIAHDRRGHGRSTQTAHGNEMDTYADDVVNSRKRSISRTRSISATPLAAARSLATSPALSRDASPRQS